MGIRISRDALVHSRKRTCRIRVPTVPTTKRVIINGNKSVVIHRCETWFGASATALPQRLTPLELAAYFYSSLIHMSMLPFSFFLVFVLHTIYRKAVVMSLQIYYTRKKTTTFNLVSNEF